MPLVEAYPDLIGETLETLNFQFLEMCIRDRDIVVEDEGQLVEHIGDAHAAHPLEQAGVEVALQVQAVDVGVGVALTLSLIHISSGSSRATSKATLQLGQMASPASRSSSLT